MDLLSQLLLAAIYAGPVACVAWTVTHEEVFREPREVLLRLSKSSRTAAARKFFYVFTCEYCFSHWVTIALLLMTGYKLVHDDWRGYVLGGFTIVWLANIYMSLFGRLRLEIKHEKTEIAVTEAVAGARKPAIHPPTTPLRRVEDRMATPSGRQ